MRPELARMLMMLAALRFEHDLRRNPTGQGTQLWRMRKRIWKKRRREIETMLWIDRIRRLGGPRMRRATWLELERWLLACGALVVATVLLRACT